MTDRERENRSMTWKLGAIALGAFGFGLSQLMFPYLIIKCIRAGAPAGARPWEGAHGLEWELPSPPPFHSWTTPPSDAVIARGAAH